MFKRKSLILAGIALAVCMSVVFPVFAFFAQTPLTPVVMKENNYAVQAGDLTLTETACDNVNGNSFPATSREILLIHNTNAGGSGTFTVTSVADQFGRLGDISAYSVAASSIAVIDMDTLKGWQQPGGAVFLACSAATMKFVVLRLPG